MIEVNAGKKHQFNVHQRLFAGSQREPVGPRARRRVEQRVHDDRSRSGRCLADPERAKQRKLLTLRLRCVDGEAARRQSIELPLGDGAKIRGTLEYGELSRGSGRVQGIMKADAGIVQIALSGRGLDLGPEDEKVRRVVELALLAVADEVDVDRVLVEEPRVEEVEGEARRIVAPDRPVRVELDVAVLAVGEIGELRRQVHRGLGERLGGERAGQADDVVFGKRLRRRRTAPLLPPPAPKTGTRQDGQGERSFEQSECLAAVQEHRNSNNTKAKGQPRRGTSGLHVCTIWCNAAGLRQSRVFVKQPLEK